MSDNAPPPPPAPSDGPPPIPQDGLQDLGLAAPPPIPGAPPIPAYGDPAPVYPPGTSPALAYGEQPAFDPRTMRIANPGWRILAFSIDGIGTVVITTIVVFGGLFTGMVGGFFAIPLIPLLSALLSTVLTATLGVTPGKAMVGIRVVHVVTGKPIGAWAILRSLVIVAPILLTIFGSSAISRLFDDGYYDGDALFGLAFFLPFVGWIILLIVLIAMPRHRGLEDLASRSIVVRR
jgi:uncharacterized RDD family membrane protein YckC